MDLLKNNKSETFSLTFGDRGENNLGMQKIGKLANEGFHLEDLERCMKKLDEKGAKYKLIPLHKNLPKEIIDKGDFNYKAYVLIIRNGVNVMLKDKKASDKLLKEQKEQPFDKKVLIRGRVVNKKARWNSVFGPKDQKPDFEKGKGTIIAFDKVPILNRLRIKFKVYLGNKAKNLIAEMNYYYDLRNCGIGFHGDAERKKVVCARLGGTMPIHFQWFYKNEPVGNRFIFKLNHGDIYIMSEKTVGTDWRRNLIPTLRHAAGSKKYTTIKK